MKPNQAHRTKRRTLAFPHSHLVKVASPKRAWIEIDMELEVRW